MKTDILVITALPLEFQAVEQLLTQLTDIKHPSTGTYYKQGSFQVGEGRELSVALVECGAGNVNAAQETERAVTFFRPDYLFMVGIAGGVKDVKIGDVVVGSEVIHYEGGRAGADLRPRQTIIQGNYQLVSLARLIARDATWLTRLHGQPVAVNALVKPIAAGEKVVVSKRSEAYKTLHSFVSQAVAVEMEGYGVLAPLNAHQVPGLVIRGISDLLQNKAHSDAGGSQQMAARHAAAFLADLLARLSVEDKAWGAAQTVSAEAAVDGEVLQRLEWRNRLAQMMTTLYEQGPAEAGGAWRRVGGRISFLSTANSVQTQWHMAIERLAQGGAGALTLDALLRAATEDFPKNEELLKLCREAGIS